MKNHIKTIGLLVVVILTISSCKKAGLDGGTTLVIFPQHHGVTIPNHTGYPDSAYISFDTQDLPSDPTHNYDAVIVGEVGEDHIHSPNMHTGKYYIYCTGWDTTINARVSGGMAVRIKYSERKKEIDLNIPVTE